MTRLLPILTLATSLVAQDIDLTGYRLTFEDNFDTLSVSPNGSHTKGTATWFQNPPYGAAGSYSVSTWSMSGMRCIDGVLNIPAAFYPPNSTWYSGQISSMDEQKKGFAQQYGYFSARMKMPNAGTGAWPAFWLLGTPGIPNRFAKSLEIDVVEWYGNQPTKAYQRLHCWNPDNSDSGSQFPLQMTHPPVIPEATHRGSFTFMAYW